MLPTAASVIVPSRGGATRLPILLDALAAQDFDGEWEVLVVLDGDIDGSRAVVEAYSEQLPVRMIAFDENQGRSAALNAGFSSARGDVLIRCDDDLVPTAHYLAGHVRAHRDEARGVVGLYLNVYPPTTYSRVYGTEWDTRFRADAYRVAERDTWRYWAGNCSVTRATWELIGPYDTAFRAYGFEDVDWGYRLSRAGIPIVLDPALETEHRIAATTTAGRAQRAFYSGASRTRFDRKHQIREAPAPATGGWNRLVAGVGKRLDEGRAVRLGAAVDRAARILPTPLGRKAVALVVEASSRAGHAQGTTRGEI